MNPLVSVMMSTHNGERYLSESIESILKQTFSDFEFLIVDDGSTDGTADLLARFSASDDRIRIFRNEEKLGLTKSLNRCFKESRGEFLCRMDDDDISLLTRLEKQLEFFSAVHHQDVAVLGSCCLEIDEHGDVIGERVVPEQNSEIKRRLPLYNPMIHPAVMMRRSVMLELNGYDENYPTSQDYDLWFRCAAMGFHFHNLQKPLLFYRVNRSLKRRKSLDYRWREFRIRLRGYRLIRVPFYWRWVAVIPLILGIVPLSVFRVLKRFDPRRKRRRNIGNRKIE